MNKKTFINNKKDSLLIETARAKVVENTGFQTKRITNSSITKYNIEFVTSSVKTDKEFPYETSIIRVRPFFKNQNFMSEASELFFGTHLNHFFTLPSMVDLVKNDAAENSISPAASSYSLETIFNYISEDYERMLVSVEEQNLASLLDNVSREEYENFKNKKKTKVFNFSRGSKMKNFVFPSLDLKQGNDQAPYYNYLKINQRVNNTISDFTVKLGLFDELLNAYLKTDKKSEVFDIQTGREVNDNSEVKLFDIADFFTNTTEMDLDNFFPLQQTVAPSKMSLEYRKHIMKGYLKNLVNTGFRSYKEIYNNKESHKELFCYSASKHSSRPIESTKLQTFYFPCGETGGSLIDTQVKYGKQYSYKVQGHYLVVGNKYTYRIISKNNDPLDPNIEVEVINEPNIVMLPSNLFMKFINIIKRPPVYPQVSFRTRNNSDKKIYIDLSPMKTDLEQNFIKILPSDEDQVDKVTKSPGGLTIDGKTRFKTYSDQGLYEIFRMDEEPENYHSFKNNKISEISMPFETADAVFEDSLVPNKKYYYMFRAVNEMSMVSNPTIVFEVELLVDADDSKVIVNRYYFKEPRKEEPNRSFRKLFRVKAAGDHVILDEQQDVLYGKNSLKKTLTNLNLGITNKRVWGRKFKIRVKSKTSGKIVDFNLNFVLSKNKTEEEF